MAHTPRGPHWGLLAREPGLTPTPHSHGGLLAFGTCTKNQGWDRRNLWGPLTHVVPLSPLLLLCSWPFPQSCTSTCQYVVQPPLGHAGSVHLLPAKPARRASAQGTAQNPQSGLSDTEEMCFPLLPVSRGLPGTSPREQQPACLILISFPYFLLRAIKRSIIVVHADC